MFRMVELNAFCAHFRCEDGNDLHAVESAVVDGVDMLGRPDGIRLETELSQAPRDCRNDPLRRLSYITRHLPETPTVEPAIRFLLRRVKEQVFNAAGGCSSEYPHVEHV